VPHPPLLLLYPRWQDSQPWHRQQGAGLPEDRGAPECDRHRCFVVNPAGDTYRSNWAQPPRPAKCSWRYDAVVGVHGQPGRLGHFSGLICCASGFACPVCSAVIRAHKADDLQTALTVVESRPDLDLGLFLTLTIRHNGEPLANLLDTLLGAHRRMRSWSGWRTLESELGIVGTVRATEITRRMGQDGTWHPHIHLWICTRTSPSKEQIEYARTRIGEMWLLAVERQSEGLSVVPTAKHGVDLRRVTSNGVAAYVTKLQEDGTHGQYRGLASELVRADTKTGRARSSVVPFELLDIPRQWREYDAQVVGSGERPPKPPCSIDEAKQLWQEFYRATKGKHILTWSPGFRELLGLKRDKTEQQIIDDTKSLELLYEMDGKVYDKHRSNPIWLNEVLIDTEVELDGNPRISWSEVW